MILIAGYNLGYDPAYLFIYLFNHFHHMVQNTQQSGPGLQFKCVFTDNPTSTGEVGLTTGVYVPYSFRTVVLVLLHPPRQEPGK